MTEVTKEFIQKNEDEKIIEIEIERLRSFKNHPFQVKDDNEMHLLKESIEKYGILTPLIVRPVPDGVYEIIAGHRRRHTGLCEVHHSHAKDAAVYGLFRKDLWNLSAVRLKRRYPCVQCR